jgi:hypothetical protein
MQEIAIVGAGPYGLSIAAHLRKRGLPFRIFGPPMDTWISHMPKGMHLKSDGFASSLYDPDHKLTLEKFCAERRVPYKDMGLPVRLDTFCAYGMAFQERLVPELENKMVVGIDRAKEHGFEVRLDNGEVCLARNVVLAVGITHFEHVPETLEHLPAEYFSHSARHREVTGFKGKRVVVIGGGASALDLAGLLHEAGCNVQLAARAPELKFHTKPSGKPRSWWQRLRHPDSGLGPGMRSRFFAESPLAFHYLPKNLRVEAVQRALGPSGGYFVHDMVVGKVPLLLGCSPEGAEVRNGEVHLRLRQLDGSMKEVVADHIIAGTGYQVRLNKLKFLSEDLRAEIRTVNEAPELSKNFECSVPGLYFTGIASANSFGPVMRFAFGAGFAAKRLSEVLSKTVAKQPAPVRAVPVAASAE